jgi:hemerythrin-like domain-containing protein
MDMPQDSGPVAVMLAEHDEGRQYTAGFRSAAEQMKNGDAAAAADVVRNVYDYVNLLREHINKEDRVLYPMAEQIIPMDAMTQMSEDFQRAIDTDEKNEIPAKYRALAIKLSEYLAQETSAA